MPSEMAAAASDASNQHQRLVVSTDEQGDTLFISPEGALDEQLSQTLLQVVTAAVTTNVERITVDLRRVVSFDQTGVMAVTCCRNLSRGLGRAIGFKADSRASLRLLKTSSEQTDTLER